MAQLYTVYPTSLFFFFFCCKESLCIIRSHLKNLEFYDFNSITKTNDAEKKVLPVLAT